MGGILNSWLCTFLIFHYFKSTFACLQIPSTVIPFIPSEPAPIFVPTVQQQQPPYVYPPPPATPIGSTTFVRSGSDGIVYRNESCVYTRLSKATELYMASLPIGQRAEYRYLMERKRCLAKAVKEIEDSENIGKIGKVRTSFIHKSDRTIWLNNDDELYYQGDIILTIKQFKAIMNQYHVSLDNLWDNRSRRKRKVDTDPFGKWPDPKQLPYYIDTATFANIQYPLDILNALEYYAQETCLRFVEDNTTEHYMRFVGDRDGCSSYVGLNNELPFQNITIGPGCNALVTIFHEISHALGLWHEQSRPDKYKYVSINFDLVNNHKEYNYDTTGSVFDYGGGYDFGSVMHYGRSAFAKPPTETVLHSIDPRYQDSMMASEISFVDLLQINSHYCTDACPGPWLRCANGGYQHPNKCSQCKCPQGFGGRLCTQVQQSNPSSCGSSTPLEAKREWKTLGDNQGTQKSQDLHCHWQIKSPTGTRIQIEFTGLRAYCVGGCVNNYIEVKTGVDPGIIPGVDSDQTEPDFKRAGYRFCCEDTANIGEFSGFGNIVMVTLRNRKEGPIKFALRYKYVTAPPPRPPSTTCVDEQNECARVRSRECTTENAYFGKKSTVLSGRSCLPWTQFPNYLPNMGDNGNHNHCRNPDGDISPWCFTSSVYNWDYCFPPCATGGCVDEENQCAHSKSKECSSTSAYLGSKSTTFDGVACRKWISHPSYLRKLNRIGDGGDHNYCRNPDNDKGPWCFTSSSGEGSYCFQDCMPQKLIDVQRSSAGSGRRELEAGISLIIAFQGKISENKRQNERRDGNDRGRRIPN